MIPRNFLSVFPGFLAAAILITIIPFSTNAKQTADENIIRIGFMVSEDPGIDPLSREAIDAAQLAVDEINEKGGIGGRKAELITRSSDGDWGSGSIKSIELIYDEEVHAIVGSLEGRDAHLVEMAIAKSHVVYLETRATDPTLSEANLPWFFRLLPSDKQQAEKLASEFYEKRQLSNIHLIYSDSYDDEMAANAFLRYSRVHDLPVPSLEKFVRRSPDYEKLIQTVKYLNVDGVLIYGDPNFVIRINSEMIESGIHLPIFTSLSILRGRQILSDSSHTQNISLVCPEGWQSTKSNSFRDTFSNTFGYRPGAIGAYSYDGIYVLAEALSRVVKSNDDLTSSMSRTHFVGGVTGSVQFLENGDIFDTTRMCTLELWN
ncbi:MAG: amino acid ABC transporter substrate-binding protein [Balneolaceae bacterium]|nr:MAG: amino acid ABC transporter substrate-binding protein [Balneolaceae bacterium]